MVAVWAWRSPLGLHQRGTKRQMRWRLGRQAVATHGVVGCVCALLAALIVFVARDHNCVVHLPDGRVYFPWADAEDDARAAANSAAWLRTARRQVGGGAVSKRGLVADRIERNCSVVGNDSSMRSARLGRIIDRADAVYRMNFAPLIDYSDAVGLRTYTQCINPEKLRLLTRTNADFTLDTSERPRVMVVGDADGSDPITGAKGPCLDYSPGGTCVKRALGDRAKTMSKEAQDLAEQLLGTLQAGAVEEAVPSTGLYCLVLALTECTHVDVYGMGVGTIKKTDLSDLEYFKDPYFHGWDARHDMELERALLRILSSGSWSTPLTAGLGNMQWHNPLEGFKPGANDGLVAASPCTSGIHC